MNRIDTTSSQEIEIDKIHVNNEWNCRDGLVYSDIYELSKQIARMGLLQPVVVRLDKQGEMHLVAGFRRVAAMKLLKRKTIMATVRDDLTELDAASINLAENIERKNLTPLEEARALNKLLGQGFDSEEIGQRLNRSALWVESRLAILRLPPLIQQEVAAGSINLKQVMKLAGLPEDVQYITVRKIKERQAALETDKLLHLADKNKKKQISRLSKGKVRPAKELEMVRNQMYTLFGANSIEVALLAWAEGLIGYGRLEEYIKEQTAAFGIDYIAPEDVC